MIFVDTRWGSGLYDFDGKVLSKVLELDRFDGTVYYDRFDYSYSEDYREATEKDIDLYKNGYFDGEGNLVFK